MGVDMRPVGGPSEITASADPLARWRFPRALAFWLLACLLASFLFAASAPSPLYPVYQARWHFTSVTLTAVYAVYAFGALAALLVAGRLADHVGRRRVTAAGLAVEALAMVAFIGAAGVPWLYAGRVLQGIGTGIAAGAINAWLLDLQPPDDPRLGSLVGGTALIAGLALGALGSGLLARYGPDPLQLVFWLLAAGFALGLLVMPLVPDVAPRRPGWLASLRPVIGVPAAARGVFAASAPSLVAAWAVAGFYLSLGPSLAIALTHADGRVAGGLVIAALLGSGAIASFAVRAADPAVIVVRGSLVLIAGVVVTLLGVAAGAPLGLYAGSIIAGLGFGPAFSGIFRSLGPLARPAERGALFAAVYIVVYLSFSVPTILAGIAVSLYGLRPTTFAFGLAVIVLAATTAYALSRRPAMAEART
jgi:MFS family permease